MKECTVCSRCYPDEVNHCPGDGEPLKPSLRGETVLDGRYQLEKRLGSGGMGIVYKARHIFLKTQHAIKVILPDLVGNDPSLSQRFRQEAMAAAAIQHPNTVNVTDYGVINGTMPFLVMEFIEGRSLHDLLQVQGKLSPAVAIEIILAVCAGVGAAHREEIVHRDLKPLNIILKVGQAPAAGVKVLDFGLAKIKSGELLGSFVAAQTQGMMGSPYYMAPEQWGDEEIDRRADIYSLGVILYQMLAGEVPFKGNSIPSIMNKHMTMKPVPLQERGVLVPPELEQAVRHALEKDPAQRPQSMEEFVAELQQAAAVVAAAAPTEVGMSTVQIPPVDTLGGGAIDRATAPGPDAPHGPGTKLDARPGPPTGGVEVKGEDAPASPDNEAAKVTRPLTDSSYTPDGAPARGTETAHQRGGATGYQPGAGNDHGAKTTHGEAPTALLNTGDEARLGADIEREREAEEARAREAEAARLRELEEARAREAEAARLREEEERRLRQEEEQQRLRAEEERRRKEEEEEERRRGAGAGRKPVPVAAIVAVVAVLLLGGTLVLAYFAVPKLIALIRTEVTPTPTPAGTPTTSPTPTPEASPTPAGGSRPAFVALAGGAYKMGRAEVPPVSDQFERDYLLWVYSQWPAQDVTVGAFEIDKTEVTNAEYAEFVRGGHPAPPGWNGNDPPAGSERLPVGNVSYSDAEAFAAWRSKRDGLSYRLPTEAEWEFAARGGGNQTRTYPWGESWEDGRANMGATAPQPVGSFPRGATEQGALDMLGNVWEWTRSTAAMYRGNNRTRLADSDQGKMVVRGGSYESTHTGNEPITVTSRRWVARDFRSSVLGFRLVRPVGGGAGA